MLAIIFSLVILTAILGIADYGGRTGVFGPEAKRKFFHVLSGTFIAFWPWWMSWRSIQLLGIGMLLIVLANYWAKVFNFTKGIERISYGDAFLAIAISLSAYFTHSKIVFALAILNVSLADGLAALTGKRFGRAWRYKVVSQEKTIVGTMTFWLVSLGVSAICLIFGRNQFTFHEYLLLIIVLPPVMAALENFSFYGIDNLTVPLAAIAIINLL